MDQIGAGCASPWARLLDSPEDSRTGIKASTDGKLHVLPPSPFSLALLPVRESPNRPTAQDDAPKSKVGVGSSSPGGLVHTWGQPFLDCEKLLYPSAISFWLPPLFSHGSAHTGYTQPSSCMTALHIITGQDRLQNFPFQGVGMAGSFPAVSSWLLAKNRVAGEL